MQHRPRRRGQGHVDRRSSFLRDGGVLNQRRLQAQVVKFVFLALGDNGLFTKRLLEPILIQE
jgi:hypothetical protein